jgi:hypothetical protein
MPVVAHTAWDWPPPQSQHQVPHSQTVRSGPDGWLQAGGLGLKHCQVHGRVPSHYRRGDGPTVGQAHMDVVVALHYMMGSDDDTIG